MDTGPDAAGNVRLAAQLADHFGARLIGTAARMPAYPRGFGETAVRSGFAIEELRQAAIDELADAERIFHSAAGQSGLSEWRSDLKDPAIFLGLVEIQRELMTAAQR